jgi:hypothetical protein
VGADEKGFTVDRRSLIKKALIVGGGAYAAPLILGTATPASAQIVSATCSSSTCEGPACTDGTALCACVSVAGGGFACVDPFCTDDACTTSADCAGNEVCFTTGCCDPGAFCVPLCGTGPDGGGEGLLNTARVQSKTGFAWRR